MVSSILQIQGTTNNNTTGTISSKRLREEDPVYCAEGGEPNTDFEPPMFIAMDPPKHDNQRKVVQPAVVPQRLADMENRNRSRVIEGLDSLPVGEHFNWVDKVSIELTTRMLATLFDFSFEDRGLLKYWPDVATSGPNVGGNRSEEEREVILMECLDDFTRLWKERSEAPVKSDFISLQSHDPATRNMAPMEYLGNLMLLIVGGSDTTRNSMSGSVLALHRNPDQFAKLKADQSLIPGVVSELIRWQTPLLLITLTHYRRVCFIENQ